MTKKITSLGFAKKTLSIVALSVLAANAVHAQSVTIWRSGTIIPPTYTKISDAINAALAGDSLVLSASTFKENSLLINKNIKLLGTADTAGMTTIDAESKGRVLLITDGAVVLNNIIFKNGKISNDAGGAICNYGNKSLVITGNSKVINSSCDGIYAYGGGVYSAGKIDIAGNTEISNNNATDQGGGVYAYSTFVLSGNAVIKNNTTDGSGGGVFAQANGACLITDFSSINNNKAKVAGGGLFGVGTIARQAKITNNSAENGGGVASYNDILFLEDSATISDNTSTGSGAGIWLNNCDLYGYDNFHITNNKITGGTGTLNFGAAIYNVNGSLLVTGGVIKGNQSSLAAVYNTAGTNATTIKFNSTHFYNPKADGTRQAEVYNSPSLASSAISFISDYCWWGSNDTTALIGNRMGTYSGEINSFVMSTWLLNLGTPIVAGTSTFPLSVDFRLNDGSKMDSLTLRNLKATFTATTGSFSPASAFVDTLNYIRSTFSAPAASDSTIITAWVDADTFMTSKIAVRGLSITESNITSNIKIYPNPASESLNIANAPIGTSINIYSFNGSLVKQITTTDKVQNINISTLATGNYLMQMITENGQKATVQFIKN
ncbi:MAG: T9SS type A sorting domain-containing protein [Chitinophagaceae bacterium]|nr:T9SS type A sorting domain-containing protein [Chitinophagaceae bacterium]